MNESVINPFEVFSSISAVAKRLNKSESTVRRMMDDGLKHRKMGHNTYVTGEQLLNYFNQRDESSVYTLYDPAVENEADNEDLYSPQNCGLSGYDYQLKRRARYENNV